MGIYPWKRGTCKWKRGTCTQKRWVCTQKRGICPGKGGIAHGKGGISTQERGICTQKSGICLWKRGICTQTGVLLWGLSPHLPRSPAGAAALRNSNTQSAPRRLITTKPQSLNLMIYSINLLSNHSQPKLSPGGWRCVRFLLPASRRRCGGATAPFPLTTPSPPPGRQGAPSSGAAPSPLYGTGSAAMLPPPPRC